MDRTATFLVDLVNDGLIDDEGNALNEQLVQLLRQFMCSEITYDEVNDFAEKTHRTALLDELKTLLWETSYALR